MNTSFIDYVALMLINMVAAFVILAWYVYKGMDDPDQAKWAPAFAMPGVVALLSGFRMAWTWPLPGPYGMAYGEMSVLLGILFAAAAVALWKQWDLLPISIYAFFAGLAAVLLGVRIIDLKLTAQPAMSGIGFILSGLGGVFAAPTLCLRTNRYLRTLGALMLLAAAAIWAVSGYVAYWMHTQFFQHWVPLLPR